MRVFRMPVMLLMVWSVFALCGCTGPASTGDLIVDAADDVPDAGAFDVYDVVVADDALDADDARTSVLPDDTATDAGKDTIQVPVPFHVAMISDCHSLPLELDQKPNSNLVALLEHISDADQTPAALFALGDNIEDMFVWFEDAESGQPVPSIISFRDILTEFVKFPWYVVLGNHDNRFVDTFWGNDVPISRWLEYFDGTGHLPARWYSVQVGGFNFVVLFGADGAVDHDTNDMNILLPDQVAWLNGQLELGLPTILLYHLWLEPPSGESTGEDDADATIDPAGEIHPIFQAIIDHPGVIKATFAGHGHGFRHVRYADVDFYEVGDVKEADVKNGLDDDWANVLLDPIAGTVTLVNYDSIEWEINPAMQAGI
ncbi:MAG TPA: metallophosphoesterase [Myxococcota bacterium]|nr:metallophosphoesterase [Myxococcota bacterium]HQP95098.1 metallophosphoesterase [Myxococcota bacterium]